MLDDVDDGLVLDLDIRLAVLTRANTAAHMVHEMLLSTGVGRGSAESIREGFQKQLLRRVHVCYLDHAQELVAYFSFEYDWEEGELLVRQGEVSETFSIDPRKGVVGQVSKVLSMVTDYARERLSKYSIADRKIYYQGNADRLTEYHDWLGPTNSLSDKDVALLEKGRLAGSVEATRSSEMPELGIVWRFLS